MNPAEYIWSNKVAKELALFVATAVALVLVSQLQALDNLFADGASVEELKTWGTAAASAIGVTAIRQALAWTIAKLAGSQL